MRKAWTIGTVILFLAAGTQAAEAFFDRVRLEAPPRRPVVLFEAIDPFLGMPAPICGGRCCCESTYSYPAYAFTGVLWPRPAFKDVRGKRVRPAKAPRYFPSRRRPP